MAHSLLAHLYTHIRGSQEDIATLSLQYLLMQSSALNKVFTKKISDILNIETEEILQYQTQATGEDDERPDMAGVDSNGNEQILCEMKFYAALTKNQPLGYLKRLEENGGKGLVFVCPKSRIDSLWFELKKICQKEEKYIEDIDEYCVCIEGIKMSIITWSQIIEILTDTAQASAEYLLADIKQLKGYCEQLDSEAFIPFKDEELAAINARKEDRFYTIIDRVSKSILKDEGIKNIKYNSTAGNKNGYISYVSINGYGIAICYDRQLWIDSSSVETPFWLSVKKDIDGKNWKLTDEIISKLKAIPDELKVEGKQNIHIALRVLTHSIEDDVCKDIKEQILDYLDKVDEKILNRKNI